MIEEPDVQEEHVHEYTEEITKPAACNAEGEKCFICTCGSTYREVIEKIPHTPVIDKSMEATCTVNGLTEGSHCSECGEIIKAQEIISRTGHKDTVLKYEKAASCVNAGYTGDIFCTECGQIVKEGEFTKQLEHTMGEGIVLKAATETEAGVTIFTCTVCQSMGVKIIPAIGSENLKDNTSHGHEYITTEVIKAPTYNSPGAKVHACSCGEYLEETIPAKVFQEKVPVEVEGSIGAVPDNEPEGGEKTDTADSLPEEKEEKTDSSPVKDGKEDETAGRNTMEKTPERAVITYKLSGGRNNKKNPQSYSGGKVALKNPTRKGYSFGGWYLDNSFKKKVTVIHGGGSKSITLYAKWNKVAVGRAAVKKVARTRKKLKVTINKTVGAEGYIIHCSADKKFSL